MITTSLYFVVFGAAIGSRMKEINGVDYGSFIVPGLMMLSLFNESYLQRQLRHPHAALHRHDLRALSAPLSAFETVLGYVGAAATKAMTVALVILLTANLFVHVQIEHPF